MSATASVANRAGGWRIERLAGDSQPLIITGLPSHRTCTAPFIVSGTLMADHFQLRLVDSSMLAPTVRHLVFEREDGQPLAFQPGQFLQVHFHYDDGTADQAQLFGGYRGRRQLAGAADRDRGQLRRGRRGDQAAGRARTWRQRSRPAARTAGSACRRLIPIRATCCSPPAPALPRIARCCRRSRSCWRRAIAKWCCCTAHATRPNCCTARSSQAFAEAHPGFIFHGCLSRQPRAEPRPHRPQWPRAERAGRARPQRRARYRLSVRQSEHGRRGLCRAAGSGPAGEADPAREVHLLALILMPRMAAGVLGPPPRC